MYGKGKLSSEVLFYYFHVFCRFSQHCTDDSSSVGLIRNPFSCLLRCCYSHFRSAQIKATDNGRPQKSSTARLHIEWIRRPPTALPLLFAQPFYNFTVMENDKVSEIVGVVSLQRSSATVWFDVTGERGLVPGFSPAAAEGRSHSAACQQDLPMSVEESFKAISFPIYSILKGRYMTFTSSWSSF